MFLKIAYSEGQARSSLDGLALSDINSDSVSSESAQSMRSLRCPSFRGGCNRLLLGSIRQSTYAAVKSFSKNNVLFPSQENRFLSYTCMICNYSSEEFEEIS